MIRRSLLLLALAAATLPATTSAMNRVELKPAQPGAVGLEMSGEYRLQFSLLDDFALDAQDPVATHGQQRWLDQRIRARFDLQFGRYRLATEWDLLTGQLAGDLWNLGGLDARHRDIYGAISPAGFVPRRAAFTARTASVDFEAGLVTSHWGLGMLANDGAHDPFFGRTDQGDRVVRVRVTGRPLYAVEGEPSPDRNKLNITGAVDLVVDDDFGAIVDRQLGLQGIFSFLWIEPDHCRHGIYVVYRHQREPDAQGTTNAFVLDAFTDTTMPLPHGASFRFAIEAAVLAGQTSRTLTYNARREQTIASVGTTGLVTLGLFDDGLKIHVRGGWASGDGNGDDEMTGSFGFDREFDVGMVLFDQVIGSMRANTWSLLTDPERSGHPPRGIDGIVNEGAAGSVVFVQPVLQGKPLPFLDLKGGVLAAWSASEFRHPFYSFRAGGTARNQHDVAPTSRLLGVEIDWSVGFGGPLPLTAETAPDLSLEAVVQGGHLVVGGAMDDGVDGTQVINHLLMTGRFRW